MLIPAALQSVFNSFRSIEGSAGHPQFRPEDFGRAMRETFPLLPGFASGALTGTGAALRVGAAEGDDIDVVNADLNFKPSVVLVINVTDPGLFLHFRGMTAAHAFAVLGAADPANVVAVKNADGITLHDDGFTLGTDADLNTDDESLFYLALGK